jgi:hypothetical protein
MTIVFCYFVKQMNINFLRIKNDTNFINFLFEIIYV